MYTRYVKYDCDSIILLPLTDIYKNFFQNVQMLNSTEKSYQMLAAIDTCTSLLVVGLLPEGGGGGGGGTPAQIHGSDYSN